MIIRLPFPPCALPGAHKKGVTFFGNPFNSLARLAGFEPAAYGLEVRSSIHLSYRRLSLNFTTCLTFRQVQSGRLWLADVSIHLQVGKPCPFILNRSFIGGRFKDFRQRNKSGQPHGQLIHWMEIRSFSFLNSGSPVTRVAFNCIDRAAAKQSA